MECCGIISLAAGEFLIVTELSFDMVFVIIRIFLFFNSLFYFNCLKVVRDIDRRTMKKLSEEVSKIRDCNGEKQCAIALVKKPYDESDPSITLTGTTSAATPCSIFFLYDVHAWSLLVYVFYNIYIFFYL